VDWSVLCINHKGIDFFVKYNDLVVSNDEFIYTDYIYANPNIFEYDYQLMKNNNYELKSELMKNRFHPNNVKKWKDWKIDWFEYEEELVFD
jgi:hypothetical protein